MSIKTQIEQHLQTLQPKWLEVINESHQHNVPEGSETHFKITVVSEQFTGVNLVQRHRMIYTLLQEEMAREVHALALHTYSPEEWPTSSATASPKCLGGKQRETRN